MVRDTSLTVPKRDSRAAVHAMLALDKLSVNTKAQVSFASRLGLFCLYNMSLLRFVRTSGMPTNSWGTGSEPPLSMPPSSC